MSEKKTWFITGAGRGMGTDFAKAAVAAGHAVVATGRNPESVSEAVVGIAEQKVAELEDQIDAYDELSSSLADEDATAGVA